MPLPGEFSVKTRLATILIACFLVISLGPLAVVAALSYSQAKAG